MLESTARAVTDGDRDDRRITTARKKRRPRSKETLEKADARKRKRRRRSSRELAEYSDRRCIGAPPTERRYRAARYVLTTYGVAPGTPAALELLGVHRDGDGSRLVRPFAVKLLWSYAARAELGRADGWLRVPPHLTERQHADKLDVSEKTIRNANNDLIAAGLLMPGEMVYCGDGVRVIKPRRGREAYPLPLERRVWLLAPAVADMLGAPAHLKAGKHLPAAFPEGAAGASPEVEGDAVASPEIFASQPSPTATAVEGHEPDLLATPVGGGTERLSPRNDEPAAALASRPADSGGAQCGELARRASTAPHRTPHGALGTDGKCGPHESTGGGDLQGRRARGARPRRWR